MINKDYILRIAERLGRELSILLGLRKRNKQEEALIYIDELLLNMTGLTSRFINSLSEETLLQTLSPLGILNVNSCLWIATMMKAEGEIYEDQSLESESYYRYVKSLHLYLTIMQKEPGVMQTDVPDQVKELLLKLTVYDLPRSTEVLLFWYFEYVGQYARAEDTLFTLLETVPSDRSLHSQGTAFYQRLQSKSSHDLAAGNFSPEEVQEGMTALENLSL